MTSTNSRASSFAFDAGFGMSGIYYDQSGDFRYGQGVVTRSRYFLSERFSLTGLLEFRIIIPDVGLGAGIQFGEKYFLGVDGFLMWSPVSNFGFGLVAAPGVQLSETWFILVSTILKVSFQGRIEINYAPRIGIRF